ncbi:MAG: hypothetical protein JNL58_26590 [Planctomyces sp.]|nr:hypothetical protein [Planctomyces sp.]
MTPRFRSADGSDDRDAVACFDEASKVDDGSVEPSAIEKGCAHCGQLILRARSMSEVALIFRTVAQWGH